MLCQCLVRVPYACLYTTRTQQPDQLVIVGAERRTKSMMKPVEREREFEDKTMRDLLTAVTKILSSTYCILIVAIYVVIVVNRFTHFTPENHHDVEVWRRGLISPPDQL